ncbi:MAG: hypothetical protein COA70_11830 [Planctomycetota bacterium]|nr:MAG: hypothetical protein COA70_11830 [Planctomycetota bacterium]
MTKFHPWLLTALVCVVLSTPIFAQERDIPVTIKELELDDAIKEFQEFRVELQTYQKEISESRQVAQEIGQILEDLRATASPKNDFNEAAILEAIAGYLNQVVAKQVGLVDYLESQRYRISYYAGQMASAVRPQELAMLFGTQEQNLASIATRTRSLSKVQDEIRAFVDVLEDGQFDRSTFRPMPGMPAEKKKGLNRLLYRYQQERDALSLAKKRLQLVNQSTRRMEGGPQTPEVDTDLLMGQMFGALGQIRLQMSVDLMNLENLMTSYAKSSRTQEILIAFSNLVQLQGDMEGPSPELAGILDWLQESSLRKITFAAEGLDAPGLSLDSTNDLLREAYGSAGSSQ